MRQTLNTDFNIGLPINDFNQKGLEEAYKSYSLEVAIDLENLEIIEGEPTYLIFGTNFDQPLIIEETAGTIYQISEREEFIFIRFNSNLVAFRNCLEYFLDFMVKHKETFKLCQEQVTLEKIKELENGIRSIDPIILEDENCYWQFILEELEMNYT